MVSPLLSVAISFWFGAFFGSLFTFLMVRRVYRKMIIAITSDLCKMHTHMAKMDRER